MRAGRFREDSYHRLCDDHFVTPTLAEQLAERRQDLTEADREDMHPESPCIAYSCTSRHLGGAGENPRNNAGTAITGARGHTEAHVLSLNDYQDPFTMLLSNQSDRA
jgi:hypothetical protein